VNHDYFSISGPSGSRSVMSVGNMSEHTTLLHDENESFALDPVDASAIRGQVISFPRTELGII
jgi:hypothetical protein